MRTLLLTLTLVFVYALLLGAGLGLVLMALGVQLSAATWGYKIPVLLFALLLWPAYRAARAAERRTFKVE